MKTLNKTAFVAVLEEFTIEFIHEYDGYIYAKKSDDNELVRCEI